MVAFWGQAGDFLPGLLVVKTNVVSQIGQEK